MPTLVPRSRNPTNKKLTQSSVSNQLWNDFNLSNQVYLGDVKSKKEKHKSTNLADKVYIRKIDVRVTVSFPKKSSIGQAPTRRQKVILEGFSDFIKRKTQKEKVKPLPSSNKYRHVRPLSGRKKNITPEKTIEETFVNAQGKPSIDQYRYKRPGIL